MLITGASGMLGNNLAWYFRERLAVAGTYHRNRIAIENVAMLPCDLTRSQQTADIVNDLQPDIIIHCAGLVDVDRCEEDKTAADNANVHMTRHIVEAIAEKSTKLVFISSDSVYDGIRGNFSETDPAAPRNYYGETKYKGECECLKLDNALVLRTNIFGWNLTAKRSLAEWILANLQANRTINGFSDAIFSTIYTMELAGILEEALEKDLAGTFNCGSVDSCSKYDFARRLAVRFGYDRRLVQAGSLQACDFIAPRGSNLSMDSGKIQKQLGLRMPTINDSIETYHNDMAV